MKHLASIFALVVTSAVLAEPRHPIDENPEPSKTGPQRDRIVQLVKQWPSHPRQLESDNKSPASASVRLVAYSTAGRPHAIGIGQAMTVQAGLSDVRKVLEDFDHYRDLFFTFKDAKAESRDGNRVVTWWEQSIPLPFVPNTVYSTYFYIDDQEPGHVYYRYQLKESKTLKYSDGVIILDAIDPKTTRYTEYDFFDADWGIAASLAPARIWRDSLHDIYCSDIAIKLKAEHPDWDYKKMKSESKAAWSNDYDSDRVGEVIQDKREFK